jgi:hypothetical protein
LEFRIRGAPAVPQRGSVRLAAPPASGDDAGPPKRTKRQGREARTLQLMRSFRVWVEDEAEAMRVIGR